MENERTTARQRVSAVRDQVDKVRGWAQRTLVWKVWERMLETEFVDRSVALAGKAFVSFFPLVIVVAAFMPSSIRTSIFTTLTHRLGIHGQALTNAKQAFASANDIRKAKGVLGLVLTFFFASSFTTALQRVYLRAWRRAPGAKVGTYTRGPLWLAAVLVYMAALGGIRSLLGDGIGLGVFLVLSVGSTAALWWFTAWFMLERQVRARVLVPTGLVTGVAMSLYTLSATVWMPDVVSHNQRQFGFFGVALALVTWFSGAAICVLIGACAGPVFAEDTGFVGDLVRGGSPSLLVEGAHPSLPAPTRVLGLRDAFQSPEEDLSSP
jgi:membrane protein